MNTKQADIILKKINRLYETMTLDEKVDVFEQDLMLSYIRQLYEAFSPEENIREISKPEVKPVAPPPKPVVIEKEAPKAPIEIPKEKPAPAPKAVKPEPVEIKPDPPKVKVEPAPVPEPTIKPPQPEPPQTAPSSSSLSQSEYEALFDYTEAKELSERLSQMPIKDLTQAMGLNEKIFTINELFGGDSQAFDIALKTLNTFNSFDQAKAYLSENIAGKFDWTEKSRKKKAINLIKLIRRRYN